MILVLDRISQVDSANGDVRRTAYDVPEILSIGFLRKELVAFGQKTNLTASVLQCKTEMNSRKNA